MLQIKKGRIGITIAWFFLLYINYFYAGNLYKNSDTISDTLAFNKNWINFKAKHSFKKLYIVFAGPYPSSPSSSLGHIFLLLQPDSVKKTPMLLWDAVNYSARADNLNPFGRFYKGIFGGLSGSYNIIPFYEKLREYTFIESRSLWIFEIKTTGEENNTLLKYLFEFRGKNYDYKFFNKNCASQIEALLRLVFKNKSDETYFTRSPREVLYADFLKNRIKKPVKIESTESILKRMAEEEDINIQVSDGEQNNETDSQQAAILLNILEWTYFKKGTLLRYDQKRYLDHLRILASRKSNHNNFYHPELTKPFMMHSPGRIGFGSVFKPDRHTEYNLLFRLGLHDFFDPNNTFPMYDYLDIIKFDIKLKGRKVLLKEFWLFNQMSIPPISPIYTYPSWKLALGTDLKYQKNGIYHRTGLFTATGLTFPVINNFLSITSMITLNPVYFKKNPEFFTGTNFILSAIFSNNMKFQTSFLYESPLLIKMNWNYLLKNSFSLTFNNEFQVLINYIHSKYHRYYGIQFQKYLNF